MPEKVLARIGDCEITSDQFLKSYSFGPSILKNIGNAKKTFLTAMINEEILSQKLYSQNYIPSEEVNNQILLTRQEMLVEKLFKKEVENKIIVTEEEIRKEYNRNNKFYKLKYIIYSDRTIAEKSYEEFMSGITYDYIFNKQKKLDDPFIEVGETDYLGYSEIKFPFNEKIINKAPHSFSEILNVGSSFIIASVADIKTSIKSMDEYNKNKERYKKIVYNRKGDELARVFVKRFMDPLKIKINGRVFNQLVNRTYQSFRETNTEEDNISEFMEIKILSENLNPELNKTIVNCSDSEIKLQELLYHLSYRPLNLKSRSIESYAEKLKKVIGLVLRDVFMEREAVLRGYDKNNNFSCELKSWRDNLVVHDYMKNLRKKMSKELSQTVSMQNNKTIALELKKQLSAEIDEYRKEINIEVNNKLLDKIEVDEPNKGRLPDVKLFKLGLSYFRTAYPVPTKVWAVK